MNKTEEHADNQYTVTIEVWPRYYRVTWKEDEEEYEAIKWDKNELGDIVSDRILELPEPHGVIEADEQRTAGVEDITDTTEEPPDDGADEREAKD